MMKHFRHFILLAVAFCISLIAASQDTASTDVASFKDSILLNECLVFVDSNNNVSPTEVLQKEWHPISYYKLTSRIPAAWITKRVYLKLNIANSAASADSIWFLPGISYRSIKTFAIDDNNQLLPIKDESQAAGYQPLVIKAGSKQSFIAELYFTKYVFVYLTPQLIKKKYLDKYQKVMYYKNAPMQVAGFVISGILIMMFIYSMANYLLSRKAEFALNGGYVTCMCLLIFFSVYLEKKGGVITSFFMGYAAFALLATGRGRGARRRRGAHARAGARARA